MDQIFMYEHPSLVIYNNSQHLKKDLFSSNRVTFSTTSFNLLLKNFKLQKVGLLVYNLSLVEEGDLFMRGFTNFIDRMVQRYLPDAFLFAVILTLIVYVLGMLTTDSGPVDMLAHWGDGFWGLLEFAMQMSLVVVTGYILA